MARRDRRTEREVARARLRELGELARREALAGRLDRADRYVEVARSIAMRTQLSLPRELRRRVCRSCYAYLLPGRTARVRLRDGVLVVTCGSCGRVNRVPYDGRGQP